MAIRKIARLGKAVRKVYRKSLTKSARRMEKTGLPYSKSKTKRKKRKLDKLHKKVVRNFKGKGDIRSDRWLGKFSKDRGRVQKFVNKIERDKKRAVGRRKKPKRIK